MKSPACLQVAILALLSMASANSLAFYSAGDNCWPSTDHIGCYNNGENECCRSADPFCVTGALLDTDHITHTTYLTNGTNCEIYEAPKNYDRCIMTENCCLYLPLIRTSSRCSAFWHFGEPSPDPNNPPSVQITNDRPCRDPNFLVYNYGTLRRIIIPDGEFEQVMEMYSRRDFSALGQYETLEGGGV